MKENFKILAINPGSTSTKIAVFCDEKVVFLKNCKHSNEDLKDFVAITDQYEYRKKIILEELKNSEVKLEELNAIVGRGGLVHPIEAGVYEVNDAMLRDLKNSPLGEHASNLGGLIADDIAKSLKNDTKAYIADPVVVDELCDFARVTGHAAFKRKSIFHALNQRAVAHTFAKSIMKKYDELNLIVVHLGGGVSVGAHCKGKVIDVNQALDGEGPFSPERTGTLPAGDLVNLCFSGDYTKAEIKKMIKGEGGFVSYLGTNDAYDVEMDAIAGKGENAFYFEAMAYQVSKEIGSLYPALKGDLDAILITGGIARSPLFVNYISERTHKLAPIHVFPGEDEMRALAMNGLMVLKGEVEPKVYNK